MDPHVREVTITEGEINALTAHQYGRPALSVPMGGGVVGAKQGWIEYEYENLQRSDVIWLALDQDEEGQKATEEIIKRLGRERCRIVELPGKDFNMCLDALMLSSEDIAECYAKAKTLDPDKLRDAAGYLADVESAFFDREANQVGMELPWEKSRDHIRFRSSELTVWTGFSGHGKSQLLGYLALHGMAKGHRFCIASMEMPAVRTLQRMVRQAAGVSYPLVVFCAM
jgi:twinkle protein